MFSCGRHIWMALTKANYRPGVVVKPVTVYQIDENH